MQLWVPMAIQQTRFTVDVPGNQKHYSLPTMSVNNGVPITIPHSKNRNKTEQGQNRTMEETMIFDVICLCLLSIVIVVLIGAIGNRF